MDKEEKPESATFAEFIFIFLGLIFLFGLFGRFSTSLSDPTKVDSSLNVATGGWFGVIVLFLQSVWGIYVICVTILSALLILGLIYVWTRLNQIEKELKKMDESPEVSIKGPEMNRKWKMVQDHINGENPAEWRLAILESDVMLEEMLDSMSYRGETLADKLKSIEKSDFRTIDLAWEAHKIRNAIAHEGSDFLITKREAQRIIGLYEKVFKEFYYI